ncbi:Centrosomal protein of 162 kDa [Manis javanica]|nr:Centrosomal protein of 162 kDa [Manis javanica]
MQQSHFLSQVAETSEPSGNRNFTDLLTELRVAQKEKISLLEDIKRLKQDKQALEVDLEKMKKERDQGKEQIAYATGEKLCEIKILEETHKGKSVFCKKDYSGLLKIRNFWIEMQFGLKKQMKKLRSSNLRSRN